MRAPQYKPTIEELLELGAIKSTASPTMVGLEVNGRILWLSITSAVLCDADLSKMILDGEARKRARVPLPDPRISLAQKAFNPTDEKKIETTAFEAPPMDFIPAPLPTPPVEEEKAFVEFDMGRASDKPTDKLEKIVIGAQEAETLEVPGFLNSYSATGDLVGRRSVKVEGWGDTDGDR